MNFLTLSGTLKKTTTRRRENTMMRMTKITSNENYQRYHIAFSHAIGFTVSVDGTSLSKTVEFT
ncbi:hypothetical protein CU002_2093 [Enterococcus faecium]|nr:hypothetical protein [Enterococcus faecium]